VACFTQRIVSNRAGHRFVLTTDPWSLMNQLMQSQKYQIIANRRWCTFQRDDQFLGYRSTTSSEEMLCRRCYHGCSCDFVSADHQIGFKAFIYMPRDPSAQLFSLNLHYSRHHICLPRQGILHCRIRIYSSASSCTKNSVQSFFFG
jgi:hypothetical protein